MIWEDAELIRLRQFDCFMETAPQLLLNLYITIKSGCHFEGISCIIITIRITFKEIDFLSVSSVIFSICSVISLTLALVSYVHKIRLIEAVKRNDGNRQSNDMNVDDMANAAVIHCIGNIKLKNIAFLFAANSFFMGKSKRALYIVNFIHLIFFLNLLFALVLRLVALSLFASFYGWKIWLVCLVNLMILFWSWKDNYSIGDSLRLSVLHIFACLIPLESESNRHEFRGFTHPFFLDVSKHFLE